MTGEFEVVQGMRLGRLPADEAKMARSLFLGSFIRGPVIDVPPAVDYFSRVPEFGMYGNDQYGDCGPVSVANERRIIETYLGIDSGVWPPAWPTVDDVYDLYKRSGNPDFPYEDNGVIMQEMLEELLRNGIGGHKPLAFARVGTDWQSLDEAIAIFGSVLLGVDLQVSQQSQTGQGRWSYEPSGEWGGHAIVAGRYTTTYPVSAVTWGSVVDIEKSFLARQLEEAWVVVWPEHLGQRRFLDSVDLTAMAAAFEQLTGREFPRPVVPEGVEDSFLVTFDPGDAAVVRSRAQKARMTPAAWVHARTVAYLRRTHG